MTATEPPVAAVAPQPRNRPGWPSSGGPARRASRRSGCPRRGTRTGASPTWRRSPRPEFGPAARRGRALGRRHRAVPLRPCRMAAAGVRQRPVPAGALPRDRPAGRRARSGRSPRCSPMPRNWWKAPSASLAVQPAAAALVGQNAAAFTDGYALVPAGGRRRRHADSRALRDRRPRRRGRRPPAQRGGAGRQRGRLGGGELRGAGRWGGAHQHRHRGEPGRRRAVRPLQGAARERAGLPPRPPSRCGRSGTATSTPSPSRWARRCPAPTSTPRWPAPARTPRCTACTSANGRQHVDHQTRIEHAAPNCTSWEVYKGILDGHAHGVFNGKVYVHPVAQKTDGKQTNKNLLLSDTAKVDTKPQLEIFADDVKCTHGATVGRLDDGAALLLPEPRHSRGRGAHAPDLRLRGGRARGNPEPPGGGSPRRPDAGMAAEGGAAGQRVRRADRVDRHHVPGCPRPRRRARRAGGPSRLPDPGHAGRREAAGLPRQRRHLAEAAGRSSRRCGTSSRRKTPTSTAASTT